jgi:hypothetical protein
MDAESWIAFANFAVTSIGVVLLLLQLRSLSTQIRLQHYSDYTRRYQELVLKFPEEVQSTDFKLEGRPDYDELMRHFRAYMDLCFEEWDLNNRKLIDPRFWEGWRAGMQFAFSKPAFKQAWKRIKRNSCFGEEFEAFVDEAMKAEFRPRAIT